MEESSYYFLLLSLLPAPIYRTLISQLHRGSSQGLYEQLTPDQRKPVAHMVRLFARNGAHSLEEIAELIIALCVKNSISIVAYDSPLYPSLLRTIADPPLVLYWQGAHISGDAVAIVGSRETTPYDVTLTRRIATGVARRGAVVVSGIARGVDREAHFAPLELGLPTIAVTACGLDQLYPATNSDIFRMIRNSNNSALVSEYPPTMGMMKWTFVRRNRIISGIARSTVVVKAGVRSGAIITARSAIDQNRDLFVCAAPPFSCGYEGCIALVNEGAIALSSDADLFPHGEEQEESLHGGESEKLVVPPSLSLAKNRDCVEKKRVLGEESKVRESSFPLTADEQVVWRAISSGASEIDEVVRQSQFTVQKVTQLLLSLELLGRVRRVGASLELL